MNQATQDIASLLGITLEMAVEVQDKMAEFGLDFSECTMEEFDEAARTAWSILSSEAAKAAGYADAEPDLSVRLNSFAELYYSVMTAHGEGMTDGEALDLLAQGFDIYLRPVQDEILNTKWANWKAQS
jgi:hypothetical protein